MKKVILIITLTIAAFALIYLAPKVHKYYSPIKPMAAYQTAHNNDDTLRIAYIGDSWAFMHQQHEHCIIPHMIKAQTGSQAKIYSYGLGGRTSKEIYKALFSDEKLGKLMREKGAEYCFISAGINDVNKKMSIKYYQESMDNIIRFMLTNDIHPIILEIPDFDVHKAYLSLKESSKFLRKLSMTINNVPLNCKQMYRDALDSLLKVKGYQKNVSVIRYKSWNKDYKKDQKRLYLGDGVHLNDYGYAILDSAIAKVILTKIQKKQNMFDK